MLFACQATVPLKQETNTEAYIPTECNDAAKFARSMAILKASGISMISIEQYMTTPAVVSFPMRSIQFYVNNHKGNPAAVYSDMLQLCIKTGWHNLEKTLAVINPPPIDQLKLSRSLSKKY